MTNVTLTLAPEKAQLLVAALTALPLAQLIIDVQTQLNKQTKQSAPDDGEGTD